MNQTELAETIAPVSSEANALRRPTPARQLPELLAPAGDWDCARAAVENGADAIYFGVGRHNARMRAHNFTEADLPSLMTFLHRRGVKGYITFNTLIFADELAEAEQSLRQIIAAGVDAAIVQDIGICRLIRRLSPDFPIHASTQMTVTSAGGLEFARELGCNLVVLARECSVADIEKMQSTRSTMNEAAGGNSQLPLEVFIHGALCVAYSGQCLTSESLGGRSANRGVCAQACRMPYDLVADGRLVPLGDRRYLLSPRDLAGLEVLPELTRAGVASLKIEGRLKSPEYVANITRIYRRALDQLARDETLATPAVSSASPDPQTRYDMEMAFSRGLHTGWLRGINNQELVHARFGKKRGVFLGEVRRVQGSTVCVELQHALKPGDGVVFDAGRPEEPEEGGRVYEVKSSPVNRHSRGAKPTAEAKLTFGQGDIDFRRVHPGDKLWKTSDPQLDRRLRQSYAGNGPHFQRPIQLEVSGCTGQPMTLTARDELGEHRRVEFQRSAGRSQNPATYLREAARAIGTVGRNPLLPGRTDQSTPGGRDPARE